jgi:hypothetical protein
MARDSEEPVSKLTVTDFMDKHWPETKSPDPVIPLVAAARQFRIAGQLDNAELQLNAVAAYFRSVAAPNRSRAYKSEARQVAYARFAANERAEIAKAVASRADLGMPDDYEEQEVFN